jgi:hypothetical protein
MTKPKFGGTVYEYKGYTIERTSYACYIFNYIRMSPDGYLTDEPSLRDAGTLRHAKSLIDDRIAREAA